MSNGGAVDTTITDQAYWDAKLESLGLGMNRGTTFSEEDKTLNEADRKSRKSKNKGGRPRRAGAPKGTRPVLTKAESIKAARVTLTPDAPGAMFQFGGFRHIGFSKQVGAGKGQKGGRKGNEKKRDFIQYVGNSYDLARLEESIALRETGQVRAIGHGPDR